VFSVAGRSQRMRPSGTENNGRIQTSRLDVGTIRDPGIWDASSHFDCMRWKHLVRHIKQLYKIIIGKVINLCTFAEGLPQLTQLLLYWNIYEFQLEFINKVYMI